MLQDYPKVITYIWDNKKLRLKQLIDTNIERVDFGDNETFKSWNGVKIVLTLKLFNHVHNKLLLK